jgi:hypothetical protein
MLFMNLSNFSFVFRQAIDNGMAVAVLFLILIFTQVIDAAIEVSVIYLFI